MQWDLHPPSPGDPRSNTCQRPGLHHRLIFHHHGQTLGCYHTTQNTDGVCLLGAPVGSTAFCDHFCLEQIDVVKSDITKLHACVRNLQMPLHLFTMCAIQHLPHLLGNDINLPLDYEAEHWEEWNAPLTEAIDSMVEDFLCTLMLLDHIPTWVISIARVAVGKGGLCILHASTRAVPDFVVANVQMQKLRSQGYLHP